MKNEVLKYVKKWVGLFGFLFLPVVILSYFGELHYNLDLLTHFKFQYLWITIAVLIVNMVLKNKKTCLCFVMCAAALAIEVLPWYFRDKPKIHEDNLKVYYANVLTSNRSGEKMVRQITALDADVVALVEIDVYWTEQMKSLNQFKYKKEIPRRDNFGIALYSRYPLINIEVLNISKHGYNPAISADIIVKNRKYKLCVVHVFPPTGASGFVRRTENFEKISAYIKPYSDVILLGDFNCAMWSLHYRRFLEDADLVDARQGFGVGGTWPTDLVTQIPIDHCFVSKNISVSSFSVLETIDSDHFPLSVILGLESY